MQRSWLIQAQLRGVSSVIRARYELFQSVASTVRIVLADRGSGTQRGLKLVDSLEAVRQPGSRALSKTEIIGLSVGTLLALGLTLRVRGYLFGTIPLWEDEAAWAIRLMDLPVTKHAIRPVGFMALTKWLAMLVAPSEAVLRALPWLAGLAALGMAW